MSITEEKALKALSTVEDPDFKKDLVTLGMIKDLKIDGKKIAFTIELTTPACPLKEKLQSDSEAALKETFGSDIEIAIEFTSRVTSNRQSKADVLPLVKNIILVGSGKGGVGKSTVSVNLALALQKTGAKVGLIDADIYGPSIPMMLGLSNKKPGIREVDGKHKIIPLEVEGLKVLSIGFLVDEKQAIVWRGPMVSSALRQFITEVLWEELDYLIIDLPPGTGDIHLSLIQTVPVTGAIIVTTPQDVALSDARKAIAMFKLDSINVPILGIIENMAYFIPPDMPDKKYFIFGEGGGRHIAAEFGAPFLGELPLQTSIREGGDNGLPAALHKNTPECKAFEDLAENVAQQIAILNGRMETVPTN